MFNDGFKNLCAQLKKRKMGETSRSTDRSIASEKANERSDAAVPPNEDSKAHVMATLVHKGTVKQPTTDRDKENLPCVGSSPEGSLATHLTELRKCVNSRVEDMDDVVVASDLSLDRQAKCSPSLRHQIGAVMGINSSYIATYQDGTQQMPRIPAQKEFSSSLYQHNSGGGGGDSSHGSSSVVIQSNSTLNTTPKSAATSTTPHVTPGICRHDEVGVELVTKPQLGVIPPHRIERTNESMTSQQQRMKKRIKTSSSMTSTTSLSTVGPWNCLTCTFYNEVRIGSRSKCEMCESPRPSPSIHMSY
jgi:hypothetical protein